MSRTVGALALVLAWLVGFGVGLLLGQEPEAPAPQAAAEPGPRAQRCRRAAPAPAPAPAEPALALPQAWSQDFGTPLASPDPELDPSEVVPFLQALTDDLVLIDCESYPCQGGAWFPDQASALEMLDTLGARYPGAWSKQWPAEDGGTLVSFVVTTGREEGDEMRRLLRLFVPNDNAVAIWFAGPD
jgi:hypothetical protein